MRVQYIYVEGAHDIRGIQQFYHHPMLFLLPDNVKQHIIIANPSITDVFVRKNYPSSLHIAARRKRSAVVISLADGYLYISDDGTIIQKDKQEPNPSIPLVRYYQPLYYSQYEVGEILDISEIHIASVMSEEMLRIDLQIRSIDITNENMILLRTDDFDVIATAQKDAAQQFNELEYMYKQLRVGGKKFTSIDVRFEKPIVKLI